MNTEKFPEIEFLKTRIEAVCERRIATPKDFEYLSDEIFQKTKKNISASTLKRIWGYDSYNSSPTIRSLDILACYAGYKNLRSFQNSLKKEASYSGFFTTEYIDSQELKEGEHVVLGWNPNRLVELEYLGHDRYIVISSQNSKLKENDMFESSAFIKGYPLYISGIERNGLKTSSYVAGIEDGLTIVRKSI